MEYILNYVEICNKCAITLEYALICKNIIAINKNYWQKSKNIKYILYKNKIKNEQMQLQII